MLAVSESDLSKLLLNLDHAQCQRLLTHLQDALSAFSAQNNTKTENVQTIHQPGRTSIVSALSGSTTLFMPVSDEHSTGFKVVTVPPPTTASSNADGAVSAIRGVINILSPTGHLEGVLSAAEITAFRTALASMIPFTRCAWIPKKHIVIFGSGKQAEWHARLALLTIPNPTDIEEITFINRSHRRLESAIIDTLIPDLRARYPHLVLNAYSKEHEEAKPDGEAAYMDRLRADLAKSNAIFCCTPSTSPLFTYEDLTTTTSSDGGSKERFISLIGSYKPHMQEIDAQTLLSGSIYVDSVEACMHEAGELIMAKVDASQLTELGQLAAPLSGDESLPQKKENVIFKCVGMGVMDLAIARSLLGMAHEVGVGTVVEGF
jgi:ornithine cyclodeaminase/alanine dehydrogenase-like protein (mu-crystallin family)